MIDADALMQSLGITNMDCKKCAWYDKVWGRCERGGDFEDACYAIEDAPTIEERKKGKWDYTDDMYETYKCSKCGFNTDDYIWYNFCPNCGEDMRG